MWVYEQRTGQLYQTRPGFAKCYGYSGHGADRDNPNAEGHPNGGPIPRGYWIIDAPQFVDKAGPFGPYVLPLRPEIGTETFGRYGFLMHGDSKEHPGEASRGCIVMPRAMREIVAESRDVRLEVV